MDHLRFLAPQTGDVLLEGADGCPTEDGRLLVPVAVAAPEGRRIAVEGVLAQWREGAYRAAVPLSGRRCRIEARDLDGGGTAAVDVFWLRGAAGKYRFTVDDCVRCFEDLTRNQDAYRSLFENPYLGLFRRAHEEFSSHAHLNLFYQSADGGFDLSRMTAKFRDEFRDNADWLSLTFHARAEFPDEPYRAASYKTVYGDCAECTRQIERFAGGEVLRDSTTLHWGAATREGARALRDFGFRALCGYLCFDAAGAPWVSYYLNEAQVARAAPREGFYDAGEDLLFPKLDLVLNAPEWTADQVAPRLDALAARPHEGGLIQMVIHEQFFYPDYPHYEPDYAQRVLGMARWLKGRGYASASLSELMKEG